MDELTQLAELVKRRNVLERSITALIGRPASIGHTGEFIAARIFHIVLQSSAAHKAFDGRFTDGPLTGRTVNIKWYAQQEGMLDITPDTLPDYYLVLTGPRASAVTSRGQPRPWVIENVYLFGAQALFEGLERHSVRVGIATSVRQDLWTNAQVYPEQISSLLPPLSAEQRAALALFRSIPDG